MAAGLQLSSNGTVRMLRTMHIYIEIFKVVENALHDARFASRKLSMIWRMVLVYLARARRVVLAGCAPARNQGMQILLVGMYPNCNMD